MSIALVFNNKDPKPWVAGVQAKLANIPIEIYPEISHWDKITFALCWKPDPDVLSKFPKLSDVPKVPTVPSFQVFQKCQASQLIQRFQRL